MNNDVNGSENVETRSELDVNKLRNELGKWSRSTYEISKIDFVLIGFLFALAPILAPLWFFVSLARHLNGKDFSKEVKVTEVE